MFRMRAIRIRASYTVEAVFIMPIVTIVIVLLVEMGLYQRDLLTAEMIASRVTEEARAYRIHAVDPYSDRVIYDYLKPGNIVTEWLKKDRSGEEEYLRQYLDSLLEDSFWIATVDACSVEFENNRANVTVSIHSDVISGPLSVANRNAMMSDTVCYTADLSDIAEKNRIYGAVMETGKQVKGVDEIMTLLGRLIDRLQ